MKAKLILPAVFALLASAASAHRPAAHRPDGRAAPPSGPLDGPHGPHRRGPRDDHHGPPPPPGPDGPHHPPHHGRPKPHDFVHDVIAKAVGGDCGPFADLFAKTVLVSVAAHEDKAAEKVEPRAFCEEMVATAKGLEGHPQAFPLGEDTVLLNAVVSLKSNATLDATAILTLNAAKLEEMHHPPPPPPPPHPEDEDSEVPEPPVVPPALEGVVEGATVVYGAEKTGPLAEQVKALFGQIVDAALKADGKNCDAMFPGQLDGVTSDFAIELAKPPHHGPPRPPKDDKEPQGPSLCEMVKFIKENKVVDGSLKAVPLSDTKAAVFWDVEPRQPPHHPPHGPRHGGEGHPPRPPRFEDAEEGQDETAAFMDAFETEEEMRAEEATKVDSMVAKKVNAKETQATARMLEEAGETDKEGELEHGPEGHHGKKHGKGKKGEKHGKKDRHPRPPRHSMAAIVELSAEATACDPKTGTCRHDVSKVTVVPMSLAAMAEHGRHRFVTMALFASAALAAAVLVGAVCAIRACRKRRASGLTPIVAQLGNGQQTDLEANTTAPSAPLLEGSQPVAMH